MKTFFSAVGRRKNRIWECAFLVQKANLDNNKSKISWNPLNLFSQTVLILFGLKSKISWNLRGVKSKMSWNPTEGRVYPRIKMVWEKRSSAKKGDHFRFKDNINFCKRFFQPHEEKLVFESVRLDSLRFTSEQIHHGIMETN